MIDNIDDVLDAIVYPENEAESRRLKSIIEAARLSTSFGIEMYIMNGKNVNVLTDSFLKGIVYGTRFPARGAKLKQRKSWVALAALSKGEIVVSTFLAEAIKAKRPASILLIGVENVEGKFNKDDVVTVKDTDGGVLGRGEVRYSSDELRKLVQKRINGDKMEFFGRSEVIHCDYFMRTPESSAT